jgi:hypothetical protein
MEIYKQGLERSKKSLSDGGAESWVVLGRNLINNALGPDAVQHFRADEDGWEFGEPNTTNEQIRVL